MSTTMASWIQTHERQPCRHLPDCMASAFPTWNISSRWIVTRRQFLCVIYPNLLLHRRLLRSTTSGSLKLLFSMRRVCISSSIATHSPEPNLVHPRWERASVQLSNACVTWRVAWESTTTSHMIHHRDPRRMQLV